MLQLEIKPRRLKGIYEITGKPAVDHRGYMMRILDDKIFAEHGLNTRWVQESRSRTLKKMTVRGFHASLNPNLEGKTITVMTGRILWVVLDIRKNSPTFGQWEAVELSAAANNSLYAERGFAHGNLSLEDNTDLLLRADNYYTEATGTGILWNDPELNVAWPLGGVKPIILERDASYPAFRAFKEKFGGVVV
jgi:dTDP-4-dehydrorhamnose 3,5-epimerase